MNFKTLDTMKELVIDLGIKFILRLLDRWKERKDSKAGDFLFSEKMRNTMQNIVKEYTEAYEEWNDMQEEELYGLEQADDDTEKKKEKK